MIIECRIIVKYIQKENDSQIFAHSLLLNIQIR